MAFVHVKYKPHTKQEFSDLTHTGASQQKGPTLSDRIKQVPTSLTFLLREDCQSHSATCKAAP